MTSQEDNLTNMQEDKSGHLVWLAHLDLSLAQLSPSLFHRIMPHLNFMRQFYVTQFHEIKNSEEFNSRSVNTNVRSPETPMKAMLSRK